MRAPLVLVKFLVNTLAPLVGAPTGVIDTVWKVANATWESWSKVRTLMRGGSGDVEEAERIVRDFASDLSETMQRKLVSGLTRIRTGGPGIRLRGQWTGNEDEYS